MKTTKKGTYIEYISYNGNTLYNLKDFCLCFNLDYQTILKNIKNNYIKIKQENSKKYVIYVRPNVLHNIVEENKESPKYQLMNHFSNTIGMDDERCRGEFPSRDWYDFKNHRIILHY